MDNIVLIAIGTTLGIGATIMVLFPFLKKKNIKADEILKKADTILNGADAVINVADKLLPNNRVINTIESIEKYVHLGVHEAEQLYLASNLNKEDRNKKAKETINAALKVMGIDITEDVEKVIDATIEMECLALGHTEKSQEEIKDENTKLKQENENLKNVVNQIKGIVPVQ